MSKISTVLHKMSSTGKLGTNWGHRKIYSHFWGLNGIRCKLGFNRFR